MKQPINKDMSPKHLLLATAQTYPLQAEDLAPPDCQYDLEQGAWVLNGSESLFIELPNRARPMTKKRDIETGEDHKAE